MIYDDKKFIGKIIKNARKKAKLTQAQLSEKLGMSEKNIGNIENGKQYPQVDNFLRIIEVLNISLDEFGINYTKFEDKSKNELLKLILNSTSEESEKYLKIIKFFNEIIK